MARQRLRSIDFWLGFERLTTLDLCEGASEKRGVDQGYLRCSAEVTNLQVKLCLRHKLQSPIRK